MDFDPVVADTARYYAERSEEAARDAFVEERTAEIQAGILASDTEVEALMDQLFANDAISDAVMVACYRGNVAPLQAVIRAEAMAEAKCRAESEALRGGL